MDDARMSKPILISSSDETKDKEELPSLSPSDIKKSTFGMIGRLLRLDGLIVRGRTSSESETPTEPQTTYYGVYIPCEIKKGPDEEALHVYKEREHAMELMKRYKQARFKTFHSMQDAVAFALRGADPDVTENASTLVGEKPYPFKGPSPQDMVALRKSIEAGLETTVRDSVWDNPRYLVSSGNTPSILQEGFRYNALHIAARAHNAEMCNLILTTVGNPDFVARLYGGDANYDTCREFSSLLVDRYLNTPDKGMNETPLHFACKFGAVDVVDVLTSFPQCNKQAVNKYGEQPKDIICNRNSGKHPQAAENILRMLGERYYVPVFHVEDDSGQPTIGKVFTPSTPPAMNSDPLSPRLEIRAYAGPMEAREAEQFRRKWKTPPRQPTPAAADRRRLVAPAAFRLSDVSKGLESAGRNLAEQMKVGWKEYWPFIDTFTDLRTPEGLILLENYLNKHYQEAMSLVVNNSGVDSLPGSPDESSISRILNQSSPSKDPLTPISDLCVALKGCSLASGSRPSRFREGLVACRARRLNRTLLSEMNGENAPVNHTVSELMCIERTCQVFAKRIADALHVSLTADADVVKDSLRSEAKHLQHTISSYIDDDRFSAVDFALTHNRLSQLTVLNFLQHTSDADDIRTLREFLDGLRNPLDDSLGSDDEKRGHRYQTRRKTKTDVNTHVCCMANFISEELALDRVKKGPSTSETECLSVWANAKKCSCEWAVDNFDRNNRRNASYKRKQRKRTSSPHAIKSLVFPLNEVDGTDANCNDLREEPIASSLVSINVDKCQVLASNELISEDDSDKSPSEDEGDGYQTASENDASETAPAPDPEEEDEEMLDTSDQAAVENFIYGEEPSKMDRLVYEAIAEASIDAEQFPRVYQFRHTIGLYPPDQRAKWLPAPSPDDSEGTPIKCTLQIGSPVAFRKRPVFNACSSPLPPSTPTKNDSVADTSRSVPLQVSSWLRVTGPNTPRAALRDKNVENNVSFGF